MSYADSEAPDQACAYTVRSGAKMSAKDEIKFYRLNGWTFDLYEQVITALNP